MIPETITYEEAIARYNCDSRTIRRAILAGQIDAYRPGRHVLIDRKSADDWFLSTKQRASKRIGGPRRGVRRV